ncbi:TPA: Arc family DNA-binding protein [Acinetobacter baumannii]|uniref:Arc family DNA-binding protein n=1 Tax=Acinetobacter calcoaceticus/baumannii complex TaxID=909768 RepID=UPI000DE67D6D|nr:MULTISPECIES: Arc family DNA-binding protein [Acinetobacter calcoaceticus/baumannii complex]MEC6037527.1 Arc family DNA-binding protein [Acinetobacter nosocomialis]SSS75951.1 phage-like protein [Acinetobacter baumannii]
MSENQKDPQYKLRWSEELRNKIADAAKENNRSINAEITTRLEESFNNGITDSAITTIIPAYLVGLITKYESQKAAHLMLLPKAERFNDQPAIKMLKDEADRCDMLIAEIKLLIQQFNSVYDLN